MGLTDDHDVSDPPAWLANDAVRDGIRALLLKDRCEEEIIRLNKERDALQEWFAEEWLVILQCLRDHHRKWNLLIYIFLR